MRAPISFRFLLGMITLMAVLPVLWAGSSAAPLADTTAPEATVQAGHLLWMPAAGHQVVVQKPHTDLGDAPDSTNSFGVAMTAYPKGGPAGVVARYPTVFKAGSPPYGPRHTNATTRFYLGPAMTRELEADTGFDADPTNNLIPASDGSDLDLQDDGTNPNPPLPHCVPTRITYTVTVAPGTPPTEAYVNLWFDWNRNGAWGETLDCPNGAAREWAVPNQIISLPAPGTYTFTTPAFLPFHPPAVASCIWWRLTLSDAPAPSPASNDGSGPANGYRWGETEDYYTCVETVEPQPDLGDAPDSTNSFGALMTAYPAGGPPGTLARYPTVYGAGSPPHGPLHHNNPRTHYYLGPQITREREADMGPDADPSNNILPLWDKPNLDLADDGILQKPRVFPHCVPVSITYQVTVPPGAPASQPFVNLWFDWDRSGHWGGRQDCGILGPANEWAVQNQILFLPGPGTYTFTTPAFLPYNPQEHLCLWWRITLSDVMATHDDGRGPQGGYKLGETEDYYDCPLGLTPTPTPTPRPTETPTPRPTETPTPRPTETPTPTPPTGERITDLGDAPDSTNSFGVGMTAYPAGGPPGILALFPTVFTVGSPPHGPIHHNPVLRFFFGTGITRELEADSGPDADPSNNIVPPSDAPDLDLADDGTSPNPPLPHCQPTQITYLVTVPPGAPTNQQVFVNFWFDFDRSGDWGQTFNCLGLPTSAEEWAVKNQVVTLPGPGLWTFTTPAFLSWNPPTGEFPCLWWRMTISDLAAPA
ncbi:MAG: GEVED domain-containing protein, partial [Caldilineales bacterium]|nr:GEVED domain-containing protein [Caldilineales bacterium]